MKCLEKTVERRYQSMGNLAEDLQRFIDGAEVECSSRGSPSSQMVSPASGWMGVTRRTSVSDGDHGARSVEDQELVAVLEMSRGRRLTTPSSQA